MTSGGVMNAERRRIATKECFLNLRMSPGVMNPTLERKYTATGNWNTMPAGIVNIVMELTNEERLIREITYSDIS